MISLRLVTMAENQRWVVSSDLISLSWSILAFRFLLDLAVWYTCIAIRELIFTPAASSSPASKAVCSFAVRAKIVPHREPSSSAGGCTEIFICRSALGSKSKNEGLMLIQLAIEFLVELAGL